MNLKHVISTGLGRQSSVIKSQERLTRSYKDQVCLVYRVATWTNVCEMCFQACQFEQCGNARDGISTLKLGKQIFLRTWNVRGLKQTDKLYRLAREILRSVVVMG